MKKYFYNWTCTIGFQTSLRGVRLRTTRQSSAFTMAEILLSLTIIGVVAAITLPSLTGNINERTWNTQRKALYARMSQAISLMPALNGFGTLNGTINADGTQAVTDDNAAETFITNGLAKVLKINNICDEEHLEDCGVPSKMTAINGTTAFASYPKTLFDFNEDFNRTSTYVYSGQLNTKAAAFETQNGESILLYYNPRCVSTTGLANNDRTQKYMCANMVYDLNGNKGPNTVGKDIGFLSVLYPTDSVVVAPVPLQNMTSALSHGGALAACRAMDSESRLPNVDELASLFYNKNLLKLIDMDTPVWSSSVISGGENGMAWALGMTSGFYYKYEKSKPWISFCVKR